MNDFTKLITSSTVNCLVELAAKNNIEYSSQAMGEKIAKTCREWYPRMVETVKAETRKADIFDNLKNNITDPLVKKAFELSLQVECIKYAEFLLDIKPAG